MGCLTDSIEINKINLPLSKKYYKELCERVEEAIYTVVASLPYGISFYQVVNTINAYLIYGIIPDTMSSPDVRLIFHLIQPELDKAVARSKRAREAAVRRREAKENKSCGPSDETTGPESSPIEAAEIAETVETSEQTKNNDRKSDDSSYFLPDIYNQSEKQGLTINIKSTAISDPNSIVET